ncbi:hypothetical protein BQ8794_40175 [Mesorhizobium prunaredense]|uniref:Uncharacterized protein n=1 Tax=Mesorhizobium prunaredense TaxID=1631249 RepID=A0A1R3VCG1_9HYPH|nr:hypothetical protein BQ8794_40175 [Mesorhizobium prunaredense]
MTSPASGEMVRYYAAARFTKILFCSFIKGFGNAFVSIAPTYGHRFDGNRNRSLLWTCRGQAADGSGAVQRYDPVSLHQGAWPDLRRRAQRRDGLGRFRQDCRRE